MTSSDVIDVTAEPVVMSVEFVNYLVALVILSLRYAAVFWYTNATFSFIFAIILIVTSLQNAFAFCGMQVLYKFAVRTKSSTFSSNLENTFFVFSLNFYCIF